VLAWRFSRKRLQAGGFWGGVAWWNLQIRLRPAGGHQEWRACAKKEEGLAERPPSDCSQKGAARLSRKTRPGCLGKRERNADHHRYLTTARRSTSSGWYRANGDHRADHGGLGFACVLSPYKVATPRHNPSEDFAPCQLNAFLKAEMGRDQADQWAIERFSGQGNPPRKKERPRPQRPTPS